MSPGREAATGVGRYDVAEEGFFGGYTLVGAEAVENLLQRGEQAGVGELG